MRYQIPQHPTAKRTLFLETVDWVPTGNGGDSAAREEDQVADNDNSPRRALVEALMDKIDSDPYPSSTMMDIVESLLRPNEVRDYAELLLTKIREDNFPSISLIYRLQALA